MQLNTRFESPAFSGVNDFIKTTLDTTRLSQALQYRLINPLLYHARAILLNQI